MESSISLEETNKIRISLGLKPLTDDGAPVDTAEKRAEDNYAERKERETKAQESKRIQSKIAKVKNKHDLNARLKGSTLADPDEDGDDALKWIKRSKKKEKELARKRQAELENMDKMFQDEYTERDLVGLKVSHDFDALQEGEARILTLKDSRILDDEEDELQNVEMAEDERTKKNNELKIKKPGYTGYDDDEFTPGNEGRKRAVLAKYDQVIQGEHETGFRLGNIDTFQVQNNRSSDAQAAAVVNKTLLSIDYSKNNEISDYLQEGEPGFKKPKTKKKRPKGRVEEVIREKEEDEDMKMDVEPIVPRVRDLEVNFVDDDELQAALAKERRSKVKRPKKLTAEEIAQRVLEEKAQEEAAATAIDQPSTKMNADEPEPLIFDDTSEFVRSIKFNPIVVIKTDAPPPGPELSRQPSEEGEEGEDSDLDVKEEEEDTEAVLMAIEQALTTYDVEMKDEFKADPTLALGSGTDLTFSSGMASTLNILRQQGVLKPLTPEQVERERIQKERDDWLAKERARIASRELHRLRARASGQSLPKDQATREYENRQTNQIELRETMENYKNYKPDVNIVYHDEFGRELTPKEAWKALSHRFHGKGSGKMKTEKRLKRIAEEKKKEAMDSGDTPLSMNKAFQIRQEKAGQAHMVLSVGNKGAVPGAAEFLDTQILSKGKTEKTKGKKKAAAAAAAGGSQPPTIDMTGFVNPTPALTSLPLVNAPSITPSGAVISSSSVISAPPVLASSPAPTSMKASFSRISESEQTPISPGGTEVGPSSNRTKVAFGFGTKRKATEVNGTPPAKRR